MKLRFDRKGGNKSFLFSDGKVARHYYFKIETNRRPVKSQQIDNSPRARDLFQ